MCLEICAVLIIYLNFKLWKNFSLLMIIIIIMLIIIIQKPPTDAFFFWRKPLWITQIAKGTRSKSTIIIEVNWKQAEALPYSKVKCCSTRIKTKLKQIINAGVQTMENINFMSCVSLECRQMSAANKQSAWARLKNFADAVHLFSGVIHRISNTFVRFLFKGCQET